jgi:hypothetical protein
MTFMCSVQNKPALIIDASSWVDARFVALTLLGEGVEVVRTSEPIEAAYEVRWVGTDYTGKSAEERRHMEIRENKEGTWTEWKNV